MARDERRTIKPIRQTLKIFGWLPIICITLALMLACGGEEPAELSEASPPGSGDSPSPPLWRYVNSGWVSPHDVQEAGPFAQELRAFVIASQEELDLYNDGFITLRTRGNTVSLGRIDFPRSVLLAAYYLWKPVQGDPLSVVDFSLEDRRATVQLELEESSQGRARPYLLAPMTMVALDSSLFPSGQPIEFAFQLDGQLMATVVATIN